MAVAKTGHCSGNLWQLHAEPFTFRLKGIYLSHVARSQQQQQRYRYRYPDRHPDRQRDQHQLRHSTPVEAGAWILVNSRDTISVRLGSVRVPRVFQSVRGAP